MQTHPTSSPSAPTLSPNPTAHPTTSTPQLPITSPPLTALWCNASTTVRSRAATALAALVLNLTADGELDEATASATYAALAGFAFRFNATHLEARLDPASICTTSLGELRRIAPPPRDSLAIVVPITCVYALIFLSGIVGNLSTCLVIARNRHMHTATNYYLFSLAVSDLLLLISGLPPEVCHIWSRHPYLFGEVFCILQGFAAETSANATVLTITAFTMERYVAICRPFRCRASPQLSRAVRLVLASWLCAAALAVPPATQFGVVRSRDRLGRDLSECTLKRVTVRHAFLVSTGLFFVAPLGVITVLYVLIGLRLRQSQRPRLAACVPPAPPGSRQSVSVQGTLSANSAVARRTSSSSGSVSYPGDPAAQARVIRMLVAVVAAFFVCWAPFHAQRLLAVYASSQRQPATVRLYSALTYLSGILYYLSTTVNPVLYHIMSNKFREAFKNTLATECGWGQRRQDSSIPSRSYSVLSRHRTPGPPQAPSQMLPPVPEPSVSQESPVDTAPPPLRTTRTESVRSAGQTSRRGTMRLSWRPGADDELQDPYQHVSNSNHSTRQSSPVPVQNGSISKVINIC